LVQDKPESTSNSILIPVSLQHKFWSVPAEVHFIWREWSSGTWDDLQFKSVQTPIWARRSGRRHF